MDRNAYRDDDRTDQAGTHVDQRETYPSQRETYPDQPETYPEPDTYWRRRAATLAAGLGVLGLLAWAFSGGGGTPASHNAARSAPAAAGTSLPTSLPAGTPAGTPAGAASPGAASPGAASPGAGADAGPGASADSSAGADAAVPGLASQGTSGLPSATSSATRKPAKQVKQAKTAKEANSANSTASASAAQAASATEHGGRCGPGSVVLSLFSRSRDYPGGQEPTFGVDVVSTARGTCTFDLSPTQFHMVVMSAGRVIWDSADCARADGTHLSKLTRGVPVQQSFAWNRAITLPGCVTLASSARPGSYTAQARTATVSSEVYSFKLVR
jgi:hypothetical protein